MKYLLSLSCALVCSLIYGQDIKNGTLKLEPTAVEGYTLISPMFASGTYLVNNCGELIHSWMGMDYSGFSSYLLEDGSLLRSARHVPNQFGTGGSTGRIEKYNWDGDLVWSYTMSTDSLLLHHDIEPLADGNILAIVWQKGTTDEIEETGRAESLLGRGGELWFERIWEIKPVGEDDIEIVWEWNVKDHLVQEVDASLSNYGTVSEELGKIDANFTSGGRSDADWLHFNGIDYNAELDQIMMSCRNTSEFYIIDHSTTTEEAATSNGGRYGKGGDLLYRWGNPQAYGRGTDQDQILFGQHDAHWMTVDNPDNNRIMVYNNGAGRDPFFSSVDVLTLPITSNGYEEPGISQAYLPDALDLTYSSDNSTELSFTSARVSGTQELDGGNILICDGDNGKVLEINEDGDVVWIYQNAVNAFGRRPQDRSEEGFDLFRSLKVYPRLCCIRGARFDTRRCPRD